MLPIVFQSLDQLRFTAVVRFTTRRIHGTEVEAAPGAGESLSALAELMSTSLGRGGTSSWRGPGSWFASFKYGRSLLCCWPWVLQDAPKSLRRLRPCFGDRTDPGPHGRRPKKTSNHTLTSQDTLSEGKVCILTSKVTGGGP